MFAQWLKKSRFFRTVSFIAAVSFFLTSVPVSYAYMDKLKPSAAKDDLGGGDIVEKLKERGEEKAREIIRRHRLTERLLSEIFEMSGEEVEEEACKFEHILSPGVTESVCTFLGHPPTCIHGKPIPRGECCARFKKEMKPLVTPLEELGLGEEGRIVFIAPKSHQRLDRLSILGIVPGSIVRMHQRNPSHVLQIGETFLALDREITKDI